MKKMPLRMAAAALLAGVELARFDRIQTDQTRVTLDDSICVVPSYFPIHVSTLHGKYYMKVRVTVHLLPQWASMSKHLDSSSLLALARIGLHLFLVHIVFETTTGNVLGFASGRNSSRPHLTMQTMSASIVEIEVEYPC